MARTNTNVNRAHQAQTARVDLEFANRRVNTPNTSNQDTGGFQGYVSSAISNLLSSFYTPDPAQKELRETPGYENMDKSKRNDLLALYRQRSAVRENLHSPAGNHAQKRAELEDINTEINAKIRSSGILKNSNIEILAKHELKKTPGYDNMSKAQRAHLQSLFERRLDLNERSTVRFQAEREKIGRQISLETNPTKSEKELKEIPGFRNMDEETQDHILGLIEARDSKNRDVVYHRFPWDAQEDMAKLKEKEKELDSAIQQWLDRQI